MCPVDPKRRYRISGNKGDSVYFSVTAYNEPSPGAWSDRIVAIVRDDDLDIDADGNFSFELGPTPDAAVLMTRDYQADPQTGRPVSWHIEALDEPDPFRHGDAETAAALRASAAWLRTMFAILPLAVGVRVEDAHTLGHEISQAANEFADPYQVPDANFGWSARDACYAYGSFVLEDDEALVDHPPAAAVPVLEPGGVEPVHGHPQRQRRAQLGQRPQRGAQRRRFRDGRRLTRDDGAPEFPYHTGLSARQPRVPVVPRRRGARPAGGAAGEGVRRADHCGLGAPMGELGDLRFCHLVVGVTDMDRALSFYRGLLGMDIVFDQLISGESFDAALHASRKQEGRVVGGVIGGLMIELLSLGRSKPPQDAARRGIVGIQNVSLSVADLDDTYRRTIEAGYEPDQEPFEIGDVRMFFVKDPDGTPVEFIELPGGARSTYEMYRGAA